MIAYDCHVHTRYSGDSEEEPRAQIEEAIRLGFKGMCFTDHMDLEFPVPELSGTDFIFDMDRYFLEMSELREEYKGKFDILIGMEAGLRNEPGMPERMVEGYRNIEDKYPLDFVIGSTHCLEFTDPYYEYYWRDKSPREGLRKYFEAIYENLVTQEVFDSLGHLDYLVRYVPRKDSWRGTEDYLCADYKDIIDMILKRLIDRGIALECNTAGIKYGLGFAHPHEDILKRYREMGGELLTIGSDGHKTEHIAYDFTKEYECLKALNFKYYTVYRERKPEFLLL